MPCFWTGCIVSTLISLMVLSGLLLDCFFFSTLHLGIEVEQIRKDLLRQDGDDALLRTLHSFGLFGLRFDLQPQLTFANRTALRLTSTTSKQGLALALAEVLPLLQHLWILH
jgi:hypothetical protein